MTLYEIKRLCKLEADTEKDIIDYKVKSKRIQDQYGKCKQTILNDKNSSDLL